MHITQKAKSELFRNQHVGGKLLILPNIWDSLGARMMELTGFPSVATASVATSMTNGYDDGEQIPFNILLSLVKKISSAVQIPLTVDIERGFAESLGKLKENIGLLIENGAVGINIEDSLPDHNGFYTIDEQCKKIEVIRETGSKYDVPVVINARTDLFLFKKGENIMEKAIERAKAYRDAGADCVYPIFINTYQEIAEFVEAVHMPVNVNLLKPIPDLRRLEEIGVARVSIGPQLLNHLLLTMKELAEGLKHYDTSSFFGRELLPREFMGRLTKN